MLLTFKLYLFSFLSFESKINFSTNHQNGPRAFFLSYPESVCVCVCVPVICGLASYRIVQTWALNYGKSSFVFPISRPFSVFLFLDFRVRDKFEVFIQKKQTIAQSFWLKSAGLVHCRNRRAVLVSFGKTLPHTNLGIEMVSHGLSQLVL